MTTIETLSPIVESFLKAHDAYLEAWRDGLARGETAQIEPYYHTLRSVYYARPGWDALEEVTPEQSIEGVRQTVAALAGARQVITDRTVLARNEREVVVFFRKAIETADRAYPAFMMQVWCAASDDGASWALVREIVEK